MGVACFAVVPLQGAVHLWSRPALIRSEAQTAASDVPTPRAVFDRYCVSCHNEKNKPRAANLALDTLRLEDVPAGAATWEKVVRKLRTETMPPANMPRPDKATYSTVASWLEAQLDRAAMRALNPGRKAIHRLNRAEYTNAIRDLLALEVDGRALLPADDSSYGFDNIADVLSVSPGLLERYIRAARRISRLAVGDSTRWHPTTEIYATTDILIQEDLMSEDLPFGSRGGLAIRHYFPVDGEYVLKVRLQRSPAGEIVGLNQQETIDVRFDNTRLKVFPLGGRPRATDAEYQEVAPMSEPDVRVSVKAGTHLVGATFPKTRSESLGGVDPLYMPVRGYTFRAPGMSIDRIEIDGPYNVTGTTDTPSRREIFVCRPVQRSEEESCATRILSRLARRAYRRPVKDHDIQPLVRLYRAGRSEGTFETGITWALEKILCSLDFLFRIEGDPTDVPREAAYRLSDVELASRLSFFLWSSIPDDHLLDVALRGRLRDPRVLEQQVRRMLSDARSRALVTNFGGQWLHLRNLRAVVPEVTEFPEFDDNLREAMQRETELFLESQLRADRSVLDLLTADYSFLNERLASHYGIPHVHGSHFRRVKLPDDRRGGLLGHASILTVTAYPTRTSPTQRGKWVLENIIGAPPPPPPPNVPALKENGEGGSPPTSVRERLEQHRRNPVCASCHARMDPLGLALENYDGLGRWRTEDADAMIDASGVLPDGTKFTGPAELRTLLRSRGNEFVTTVTEKLLTYALGRGVEYYDMPSVRQVMREAAPSGYRWSALILGIVKSTPFQMRRAQ